MSTTSRLVSGTLASWVRIGITMITQIVLVPLYLSYWDVKTYGVWIAVQAIVNVVSTLDRGFVDYLGYEFLKIGNTNRSAIAKLMWPAFWLTLVVGFFEMICIYFLSKSSFLDMMIGDNRNDSNLIYQAGFSLLFQWIGWTFLSNTSGLFFRALTPFGYFPRMGWWNVFIAIITSGFPVVAVMMGADLFYASLWSAIGLAIISIPQFIDLYFLLKKESLLQFIRTINGGFKSYKTSLSLSARYFLENFRQQGVRFLLAPLSGVTALASFSTMRTGANVTQQGLMTITQPLLPELMRFLNEKDHEKIDASFSSVWFVLVAALAPGVVLLQAVAPTLFELWTKGQIDFDPLLFGVFSLGVLMYALAQPAMAIVVGNNLLKEQMFLSIICAILVVSGLFLLVPLLGILGGGIALLISEIAAAVGYTIFAKRWLIDRAILWPKRSFRLAVCSLSVTAIGLTIMILLPNYCLVIATGVILSLLYCAYLYAINMPTVVKNKFDGMFRKIIHKRI